MRQRFGRFGLIWLPVVLGFVSQPAVAHESPQHRVNANMAKRTSSFLDTLSDDLRKKATFAFEGPERNDWHFVPKQRVGVMFKELNLEQRRAAHRLLQSGLSAKGYLKATTIMSLEQILRVLEADRPGTDERRDQEKYWLAVFGHPGADAPWGWRVEGHHLSINFSSVSGAIVSSTPLFLGANPAEVRSGPRAGLRVLGREEDLGRQVMRSLDEAQRKLALIATEAPADVITVPGHDIDLGAPAGIALEEMPAGSQKQVLGLIRELASNLRGELAAEEMQTIRESDTGKIHFAWAGSLKPGAGHYYRIHGSSFIIEYDNTQNQANHAHLVWHSMTNDFGLDSLKKHHAEHHTGADLK